MNRADELRAIVGAEPWIMGVLATARALRLPDWFVGAGAIRDLVWDVKFGSGFDPARVEDVDLVYFDASDLSHDAEVALEGQLGGPWDVKNQARVHLWYPDKFGETVAPLTSTTDGISTWPEPCTCIGVRLEPDDTLTIAAPLGLDDLLDGIWRVNPVRVTEVEVARRLARKDPGSRWPAVRVS